MKTPASKKQLADETDIKEKLLPSDTVRAPYGYKITEPRKSKYFTVFYENGTLCTYDINIGGFDSTVAAEPYDGAPVKGVDPWFRVTGARGCVDRYYVENRDDITFDT